MRALVVLITLLLGGPLAAQSLVIATTGTFPPYLFEEGEHPTGFDIELMDELCRRNGFTCEYRIYPLLPGLEAVARGEADIALGGIGITAEREAYGNFTCPYRGGRVVEAPIFALNPNVQVENARIAVLGDSLAHRDLEREGLTAIPFDSLQAAIQSVLSGETDAYTGNTNSLALVEDASGRMVVIGSIQSRSAGAGFLVSAAQPRLLTAMNDTLLAMIRDGSLARLSTPWFGPASASLPTELDCVFVSAQAVLD